MTDYQELIQTLRHAGMRITHQRIAICRLLCETDDHPTAAKIYAHLKPQFPSLSLATVYNTLEVLVELGMVSALGHAGDDNVHYDADTTPHINLACLICHRVVDAGLPPVHNLSAEISQASGYKLLGSRLMYYGICPACQTLQTQKNHN